MELKPGYKRTEVGVIPEEWEVKSFAELAILERGKFSARPRNDPKYYGGDIPFIQTGDVTNSAGYITSYSQTLNDAGLKVSKLFPQGTLFFTIAANIGDLGFAAFSTACPDSLIAITTNSSTDVEWLFHELKSKKSTFEQLATQNAQLNINLEKLRPFALPRPPLPEQRAIAAALSDVDALIAKLDQLLTKKRDLKQAAMQQLLTGKRRLPGFSGEWEEKRLGDALERIVGGGTPSRSNPAYWGGEIPWVTVKDFTTFNPLATQEYITSEGLKSSASNLIPHGTIITSTRMALGKAVIYEVDVSINQDLKALFPKPTINTMFLCYWFEYNASLIEELGSGSTVKGISLPDLKSIPFSLASVAEQTAIAAVLSDMDAEIAELEARRDKTRALKQGMMQELLTGRIRLV
ncbi:MAG: restriction endonuclease subunit S [Humidesulfovibrio sp.]|uniref:restriction endonuclease subunit S n=1 Tax=Humidesulfovibrio sp. TaxID=2910988 RepID=UPI0027F9A7F9|nr:restriction endonuclease subunit S [Humidesulfovibrio sp.]MDQ7835340.1 restriction endonuclease subunit S [Humidesulfovibrio sp.]